MKKRVKKNRTLILVLLALIVVLAIFLAFHYRQALVTYNQNSQELNCTSGVISYWPLNSSLEDFYGSKNLQNHGTSFVTGKIDQALGFNGIESYVSLSPSLNNLPEWTWSAWVYPSNNNQIYSEGIPAITFGISTTTDGKIAMSMWNSNYPGNWLYNWSSQNAVTMNSWNFISVSLENGGVGSGTLRFYVNGNYISSSSGQMENNSQTSYALIGDNIGSKFGGSQPANPFNGTIDEVSIFNRALSSSEISNLYNSGNGKKVCELQGCIPQWIQQNTSCLQDETKIGYFSNLTACNVTKPNNITYYCDYNNNGVIGNFSRISSSIPLTVYINNTKANNSKDYSSLGVKKVQLRAGTSNIIEFNWDFTEKLNLFDISIEKQSSTSTRGYLIIKGINVNKKVLVDKLKSNSTAVCITNYGIETIDDMADSCSGDYETRLDCPGSDDDFTCNITGNYFQISGLTHSAVMELTSSPPCIPNWTCTGWGSCINNTQRKTCIDVKNCNSTLNRPALTQTCNSSIPINPSTTCTPNWTTSSWTPEECPESREQTRIVTDSKNCGVSTGRPSETRSCEYKSTKSLIYIIIIAIVIIIIIVIFILIYMINKKNQSANAQNPVQYTYTQYPR